MTELPEAIGTGTEWMNGYRQAQREDKAELDRLRAEIEKLRLMPDDNREQLFKVTAMAKQLNEENERLRAEVKRLEAVQSSCHRDIISLSDELDRLRAELTTLQLKYDNSIHHGCTQYEIDRLRAENEALSKKEKEFQEWRVQGVLSTEALQQARVKLDRLRAENAELRGVLEGIINTYCGANAEHWKACDKARTILARTAKEGPHGK